MKKKAFCVLKGKQKTEFDLVFNRAKAYQGTIERLSINILEDEKTIWDMVNNSLPENKRLTVHTRPHSIKYDTNTGEVYINETKERKGDKNIF